MHGGPETEAVWPAPGQPVIRTASFCTGFIHGCTICRHANISKRLIKTPKLYFWDVGLAAYLLGMEEEKQVARDPLRGSLFENMVVAELFKVKPPIPGGDK